MLRFSCSVFLGALLSISASISAVAQTNPGSAQAGAGSTTMVGCVQKSGEVYTLTDDTTKATVQLRGGNLRKGRHVEVTGTPAANAGGATQVFDVSGVKRVGGGCQAQSAGGSGKSFMSRGTVASIGVIGGVAIVAVLFTVGRLGEARGGK